MQLLWIPIAIKAVLAIQATRSVMAAALDKQSLDEAIVATYSAADLAKAERLVKRFNIPDGAGIKLEDQVQLACALRSVLGNDARVSQKLFETRKP